MGTDIHTFVEIRYEANPLYYCVGQIELDRDYQIFNMLGNGRNYWSPKTEWELEAHIPPRGAPPDISLWAARLLYNLVLGSSDPDLGPTPNSFFWEIDRCVSKEEAERRVKAEKSFIGEVRQDFNLKGKGVPFARWQAVPRTGNHSPSYLSFPEIEETFAANGIITPELPVTYRALMAFMRAIGEAPNIDDMRLLFWFDN
jgi:hypothetical protein